MATKRYLSDPEEINKLANFLSQCSDINKLNQGEYDEAGTLAHAFSDLEESFNKFLNDYLPKLVDGKIKESEIKDCLLEIGEEFRHILYHIHDPKFYGYLHE